jgi:RNA recognition motif-containing protein
MIIYIANLSSSTCGDDLRCMFAEFGKVLKATVITDRYTLQSKRFGFVEMPINVEADLAIRSLNGILIDGKNIKVDPAIQTDIDASTIFHKER